MGTENTSCRSFSLAWLSASGGDYTVSGSFFTCTRTGWGKGRRMNFGNSDAFGTATTIFSGSGDLVKSGLKVAFS